VKIFLSADHALNPVSKSALKRWAGQVVRRVKGASFAKRCELSLVLTGDARVRKMNKAYRKKDKTTDVLAFPLREGRVLKSGLPGSGALGDVMISVPQTLRQAKAAGKKPKEEMALLLTHGILHLLGYDHATPAQEKRMFALQDKILRKLA
jgi:rRNA maturation RNase YbeY